MATPTEIVGRYRVERRLGAGGMSTVFLAVDSVLERQVAVKLLAEHLADDVDFVARFRREALAAARLQHPNIVQVFDSGEDPESHRHFIVMEYVDGPSAADLLRDRPQLDVDEAVAIVRDACHGLRLRPPRRRGAPRREARATSCSPTTPAPPSSRTSASPRPRSRPASRRWGRCSAPRPTSPPSRPRARRRGRRRTSTRSGCVPTSSWRGGSPRIHLAHRARAQAAAGRRGADHRPPA